MANFDSDFYYYYYYFFGGSGVGGGGGGGLVIETLSSAWVFGVCKYVLTFVVELGLL